MVRAIDPEDALLYLVTPVNLPDSRVNTLLKGAGDSLSLNIEVLKGHDKRYISPYLFSSTLLHRETGGSIMKSRTNIRRTAQANASGKRQRKQSSVILD